MTPWVLRLLVANAVMFFLVAQPGSLPYRVLAFVPAEVLSYPWTPVTYMFLHANLMHLVFNMVGLYFFGPRLEARIGSRDFLLMYLVAGLTGAVGSFLFEADAAIVGASGAVFGVLLGFARYWPHERIYIWAILPVPARVMVVGLAVLSIYSGFTGAGAGVAHFAHLGGFVGGWAYLKLRDRRAGAFKRKVNSAAGASPIDRVSGRSGRDEKKWRDISLDDLHEINRQEVERIRSKIEDEGAGSLTPDERAFMNRMVGR